MQPLADSRLSERDDQALVERLREGDAQAAEALAGRWRETIVRFCVRYLGQHHDAEDAAQDVLATIRPDGPLPEGSVRAWLLRSARNRCLDLLRRRADGRVGAGSMIGDLRCISPRTGPRTALLRKESEEQLRRLIDAMSEHHREALILRYFEGLSRAEIAEVLELPETTVKSRLFEARKQLKQRLNDTENN